MSVLVLDGDTLPALAIIRSLGRKDIEVCTASHSTKAISNYSKYSIANYLYPDPLKDTKKFTEWIEKKLETGKYELIIPATERTLIPIARYFENSPHEMRIAMPSLGSLEAVLDKSQTHVLAENCRVPQPKSWDIQQLSDINRFKKELHFPLVIKPGRTISDTSRRTVLTVRYAHSYEELIKLSTELLIHTHIILQEYFRGTGCGIELIARHGEILYAFQHQRIHEMPLTGGGSSYRRSVAVDPLLLEASRALIKALCWHGVAMVEFKKNIASGEFILIEINGRFWGSLPLAVAAGADFPYMLYQLYTKGSIQSPLPYRQNISCRKLSSDLAWLEAVLRKDADQRLVDIPGIGSAIGDFTNIFSPRHYFDAQSLTDPKPGLFDLKNIFLSYFHRLTGVFQERKNRNLLLRESHFSHIQNRLTKANNILFVCYGNINRSALAEVLAGDMVINHNKCSFKSAGFHPVGNRPADSRMVALAKQRNFDLSKIRSSTLSNELINWADLIFVMETTHMDQLRTYSDSVLKKCFLLGGLLDERKAIEILDPYNKSTDVYEDVFEQINLAIANFQKLLNDSKNPAVSNVIN